MGRILDLIYPKTLYCICCNDFIDQSRIDGICNSCTEKIQWDTENHFRHVMDDFAFDDVLSCCLYGSYPRSIIYKMKMQGAPYVARYVGKLLADRVRLSISEDDLSFDYLVPVPCTKEKKLKRGFNQAELIADYASKEINIPTLNALRKIHSTKQSKEANGIERHFVQQGAFDINLDYKNNISDKNILLVDDVVTTGNTMHEAACVLLDCGAMAVLCCAFASSRMSKNLDI